MRNNISTASPYEPLIGISRAVRIGGIIAVSGTAPLDEKGKTVSTGDPAGQARRCFEIIKNALEKLDASLEDVIRTRILLTDIKNWEAIARVHGEYFKDIRPVSTMVQVSKFIDPDWLVEIEADAVMDKS